MFLSKRFILSQIFFSILLIVALVYNLKPQQKSALPIYGNVSQFKLIDQNNTPKTLEDFKGRIWVADFIFTSCSGICPTMSKRMMELQHAFARLPDVRVVSISVNPENDSPKVLQNYAKKQGSLDGRWVFLIGQREEIQKLAIESFKMGDMKDIAFHSSYFSLVDRNGAIRGYYDGMDQERIKQLHADVFQLEREK